MCPVDHIQPEWACKKPLFRFPSEWRGIKVCFLKGVIQILQEWSQSVPLFPAASMEAGLILAGMKSAFIFCLSNFLVLVFINCARLSLLLDISAGAVQVGLPALLHRRSKGICVHLSSSKMRNRASGPQKASRGLELYLQLHLISALVLQWRSKRAL